MAKTGMEETPRSGNERNSRDAQAIEMDFEDIVAVAIVDIAIKNRKKRRFKPISTANTRRP